MRFPHNDALGLQQVRGRRCDSRVTAGLSARGRFPRIGEHAVRWIPERVDAYPLQAGPSAGKRNYSKGIIAEHVRVAAPSMAQGAA